MRKSSVPTPGPWSVHPDFPHVVVPSTDIAKAIGAADSPAREAELYAKQIHADWQSIPPYDYDHAAFSATRTQREEARANASLIAAAPRMYAFIEFCAAAGNLEAKAILEEIKCE